MDRCTDYQGQMLELVYDLLDEDALRPLQAHLEHCADCRAAVRAARGQQQLLAAAARLDFASVSFRPPAAAQPAADVPGETPAPERPAILSLAPARRRRSTAWRGWVSAAAVLLALSAPAWVGWDYTRARHELGRHQSAQAALRDQADALGAEFALLDQKQRDQQEALAQQAAEQELNLTVSGPRTIQPGVPSEYQLLTRNGLGETVPARIHSVKVLDRGGGEERVLFEKHDLASNGTLKLRLPGDLDVGARSRVTLQVAATRGGPESRLQEDFELTPRVYRTHLVTDRPLYQPGETVRFRALTLERFSLEPAKEKLAEQFRVATPTGAVEVPHGNPRPPDAAATAWGAFRGDRAELRGIAAGEWQVPAGAPTGEYALTVRDAEGRFPPQTRTFRVDYIRKPRLLKELDFARRGYGPGDEVVALCAARTADGAPLAGRPVTAAVTVDGRPHGGAMRLTTDAQGKAVVRFRLPMHSEQGEALLSVAFDDGAEPPEEIARAVPLALRHLAVEFFPEGGRLVPGGRNRVYFRASSLAGRPAAVRGRLLDRQGDEVARVETSDDDREPAAGLGSFWLRPYRGQTYTLHVDRPAGVESTHTLSVEATGKVALAVPAPVSAAHEPIDAVVRSAGEDRALLVAAYCRGRLVDHWRGVAPADQEVAVRLYPAGGAGGVFRLTVFEEERADGPRPRLVPHAERLVFRRQRDRLNLAVKPGKDFYLPGERATLRVESRGEDQEPISSVAMVSVVDRALLSLVEGLAPATLPAHFTLLGDIEGPEELEQADVLLAPSARAAEALDLVLGTQGWRRFPAPDGAGGRALAMHSAVEVPRVVSDKEEGDEREDGRGRLGRGLAGLGARFAREGERLAGEQARLSQELEGARSAPGYLAARDKVDSYEAVAAVVRTLFPLVGLFLLIAAALLLGRALALPSARGLPYFSSAAACAGLLVILGAVAFQGRPGASDPGRVQVATDGGDAFKTAARSAAPQGAPDTGPKEDPSDGSAVGGGVEKTPAPPVAAGPLPAGPPAWKPPENMSGRGGGPGFQGPAEMKKSAPPPKVAPPGALGMPAPASPGLGFAGGYGPPPTQPTEPDARPLLLAKPGGTGPPRSDGEGEPTARERDRFDRPTSRAARDKSAEEARRKSNRLGDGLDDSAAHLLRQYAQDRGKEGGRGGDLGDTVYWHPALVLPGGRLDVSFPLNDAVTSYQVTVFGHTLDGRLAAATRTLEARRPLGFDVPTPAEVTAGDRLALPFGVVNRSGSEREVLLELQQQNGAKRAADADTPAPPPKGPDKDGQGDKGEGKLRVPPGDAGRLIYEFSPNVQRGDTVLRFQGRSQGVVLEEVRRIKVVPPGFPAGGWASGLLEGRAEHAVELPGNRVPGTLECRVEVFPSALAGLHKGLEALQRQPDDTFEQAAARNAPSLLILGYLSETGESRPEVERLARRELEKGYQRFADFECLDEDRKVRRGYEWFGGTAPPHEELTAYGLLQLRSMARVQEVDPALLERTRKYLLSLRDGKGGFRRGAKGTATYGRAPDAVADAYIVRALSEVGAEDLGRELDTLAAQARTSNDPYFLALVAGALANRSRQGEATGLLQKVAAAQREDGRVDAAASVTGSRGRDLQIEATALAVLAWQKAGGGRFDGPARKGVRWLSGQRDGQGTFGSTQATVLALKALASARHATEPAEGGEVAVLVGNREVGRLRYAARAAAPVVLKLPEPEKLLGAGRNVVRLRATGKGPVPYTLAWSYRAPEAGGDVRFHAEPKARPVPAANPVRLETVLDRARAGEGETVRLTVRLENASDQGQGLTVAVVGLPAGLSLPAEPPVLAAGRLSKDWSLSRSSPPAAGRGGGVASVEARGRELYLYWRDLGPRQKVEVPIDLVCRVPGEYRGPASRAYLHYNADAKTWVDPLRITILPRTK